MTVSLVVELAANLVQQITFFGFLYLFLDKDDNKAKNIAAFSISVFIMFTLENYFTFHDMTLNHIDTIIDLIIMLTYSILFLKGKLYLRILMPITVLGLNILIAVLSLFIMSSIGDVPFEEAIRFSTSFRYLYLVVGNLLYIFLLLIVLRIGKRKIHIADAAEVTAFVIFALALFVGSYSTMLIDMLLVTEDRILPYVLMIFISMFSSTGVFWFLLLKISKDSNIKTDLLLSHQREELYKNSVLATNEQIKKVSDIKHDMMNNLMSFSALITDGEYAKARRLCDEYSEKLSAANTPVHTNNPVLNAIVNVEIEKSEANHIDFTYEINDELLFVSDSDIISIIGNLCDNAIEYLITVPEDKRQMYLAITVYRDYYCITSKNTILSSVINANPDLKSSKKDLTFHGKGTKILKDIAEKYSGELIYSEEDGWFIISAIIRNKN